MNHDTITKAVNALNKEQIDAFVVSSPENFAYLRTEGARLHFKTSVDGDLVRSMGRLAAELSVYLLLGAQAPRQGSGRRCSSVPHGADPVVA